jgi:hypothetical protein
MNSERRVQRVRQALLPLGNSKSDWQILCEVAKAMGSTSRSTFGPPKQFGTRCARCGVPGRVSVTPVSSTVDYSGRARAKTTSGRHPPQGILSTRAACGPEVRGIPRHRRNSNR